jgi:acyl-CoA thioester hydrolase
LHQPSQARAAAPRLEHFKIRTPDIVRFGDMDRQGHVNNAVYSTYLETGRVAVIHDPDQGLQVAGTTTVLARIQIDFLKELHWPAQIEIGTAVAEIGRSSYVLMQGIFCEGVCAATGRCTMVLIDLDTRRARPLPPILVDRLKQLQLAGN